MHVRPPDKRLVKTLQHEQAVEARQRKAAERAARRREGSWKQKAEESAGWNGDARRSLSPT